MLHRLDTFSVVTKGGVWRREGELDHFIGPRGNVDFGRVLERLDLSVAEIAQEQAGCPVVTIAVQGSPIRSGFKEERSYIVNRYVTNTQGKSLEVAADILSHDGERSEFVTALYFTFAGWENDRTIQVRPATPSTELEERISQAARRRRTENLAYRSGDIPAPTQQEQARIEELRREHERGGKAVKLSDTTASQYFSVDRRWTNPHGYAYGGAILQQMYDRALHHAYAHISNHSDSPAPLPLVSALNRATFDAPLRIGSQVECAISTVFTGERSLVERVTLTAHNADDGSSRLTNTALFTFSARDAQGEPLPVPAAVVPYTQHEMQAWIEASRHREAHRVRKAETPMVHPLTRSLLRYPA